MSQTKRKKAEPRIKLQTITITNPNNLTKQAVLNIYFIGDDIVFGGINWYEYFDYEKMQQEKKAHE